MATYGCFRAAAAPVGALLTLLWLGPVALSAQTTPTLGEIAKKEEERRKALKTPAKVYTNKDLPKSAITPPQPATPGALPPATPPAEQKPAEGQKPPEGQKPDDPKEEKDEAWWRKRITAARDELQRAELAVQAFQSRVNGLTTDFVNRDDPYQRAQIAIDRQKALGELERVKADVIRLKTAIDGIEEEARVAGVPPGWLR
jgi:hypothetical protein